MKNTFIISDKEVKISFLYIIVSKFYEYQSWFCEWE